MQETSQVRYSCESNIHREIFKRLVPDFSAEEHLSEDSILQAIAVSTSLLGSVVESWKFIISDKSISREEPSLDFYRDDFLGHDLCSNLAYLYAILGDHQLSILEEFSSISEQRCHDLAFEKLVEYMDLHVTHHGLGDITKRTISALASMCSYSDEFRRRLLSAEISKLIENGPWDWRAEVISEIGESSS
jgi:hypothetical protein